MKIPFTQISAMLLLAIALGGSGVRCLAQNLDPNDNAALRGPQDIINSSNARDSYGNPRPVDNGGYNAYGNNGANAMAEPGAIRPFTDPANGYQAVPGAYPGSAGRQADQGAAPGAPGAYPGGPGYQNGTGSYPYSAKHHKHKNHQRQADPASANAAYAPPGGLYSGAPSAAYTSNQGGNSSLAGAAVGVPDRAAKSAIGVTGKAAKEVLKGPYFKFLRNLRSCRLKLLPPYCSDLLGKSNWS